MRSIFSYMTQWLKNFIMEPFFMVLHVTFFDCIMLLTVTLEELLRILLLIILILQTDQTESTREGIPGFSRGKGIACIALVHFNIFLYQ